MGDSVLLNKSLDLSLKISRQDSHQGLGGKPVLGSLLVVTLGHVSKHGVGSLVDVVDDLAKVGLEVCGGEVLKVGQGSSGDVSLPLKSALAFLHHSPEVLVLLHVLDERLGDLQLVSGGGGLAAGRRVLGLVLLASAVLGQVSALPHVGGEDNQGEVLGNVIHYLGLEEHLGGVIHDLIAELRLGDVLPELLDASAPSLGGAILVNDLVALPLGGLAIGSQRSHELLDNLKLSPEEGVLVGVHLVPVHLEQGEVHARDSLHQTLVGGAELELFEHACSHTGGGGTGETNLVIEDDWGVDGGSH